jgi:hypothetical protein
MIGPNPVHVGPAQRDRPGPLNRLGHHRAGLTVSPPAADAAAPSNGVNDVFAGLRSHLGGPYEALTIVVLELPNLLAITAFGT